MQKFDFKDITLVPEPLSFISSRSEINIYTENGKLPIIVSPMDTVVDETNHHKFVNSKLEVCLPREEYTYGNYSFTSISLHDFECIIRNHEKFEKIPPQRKILVDIANGHMFKLYV